MDNYTIDDLIYQRNKLQQLINESVNSVDSNFYKSCLNEVNRDIDYYYNSVFID